MAKVISIHSFRGGTGKSNITANLATLIAQTGLRVGIIDTDIQSPGIHVPFGLDENQVKYTLNDYLWGRCPIESAAYDMSRILAKQRGWFGKQGKLYLVPSSIKTAEISRILREGYDARLLNEGLRSLIQRLQLDFLMIDTHPGINEETLLSAVISDVMLVVLRPDKQDYQGTAVTIDVARKLGVPKLLTIVNKALPSLPFDQLRQQVQANYNVPVAGILPVCEEMFQLASSGIFCLQYPDHTWSQTVTGIVRQLGVAVKSSPPVAQSGAAARSKSGFFA
jgi:MinD-like ATPase involved in chromosome partitioning or flagellar assembly